MIIFSAGGGFRNETRLTGSVKALFALAVGISLIVTKANAMTLLVQVVSVGIMVLGVAPLLLSIKYPALQQLASGAPFRILLSVLLFAFADPVASVIRYILGGILTLVGISQVLSLPNMGNAHQRGPLPYAIPVLLLAGGVMFFSEELIGNDIMGLMAGAALILYGCHKGIKVLKMKDNQQGPHQYYTEDDTVDEQ